MSTKQKHILVTGGAGFIGSHTVVELIEAGYTPVIIDDFRNSERFIPERLEKLTNQKIIAVDAACQDVEVLDSLFSKYNFEGVIHFAADKAVGESVSDPLKYYDNNLSSLISILRMMDKYNTKSLVFSSSCTVYGNPKSTTGKSVVTEDSIHLNPDSPYGNTKLIGEQILQDWIASSSRSNVALLRYFNPIGAHASGEIGELPQGIPNNLLPYITQTAVGIREKLTVFGNDYDTEDGTCIRDYIHVCDLADAHVSAIKWLDLQTNPGIEIFNIGTGKGTSVLEMVQAFEKVIGKPLSWEYGPKRSGDIPEIYANPIKAKEMLQWESKFSIFQAIEDAWRWENNRPKND
ncbi:MAG: UDP-glucose 4-epimerase GalE [Crocinitomicaceae bacterium]|nr:UDP-glucose 4-epimerase GalE [Crocinitomicaceae bacterium]